MDHANTAVAPEVERGGRRAGRSDASSLAARVRGNGACRGRTPAPVAARHGLAIAFLAVGLSGARGASEGVSSGGAPGAGAIPTTLDELIELVSRANPNVLLAETRLREAEAELRVARVAAAAEAVELFYRRMLLQETLAGASDQLMKVQAMADAGTAPQEEMYKSRLAVQEKQIALGETEAALRLLIGRGPGVDVSPSPVVEGARGAETAAEPRPEMPDAYRALLVRPIGEIAFDEATLEEAIRVPLERAGIDLGVQFEAGLGESTVSVRCSSMPLGDYLLALADRYGFCFVLRDYGFFVTTRGSGARLRGPAIPADLPYPSLVTLRAIQPVHY